MKTSQTLPLRGALLAVAASILFAPTSHALTVFFLGDDETDNFQDEFDQESGNSLDDDYYVENGDYTGLTPTSTLWTGGMEVLKNGITGDAEGLPRAVTTGATTFHIHFQLDEVESDPAAEFTFNTDLCCARGLTTSEVRFSMNGVPFHIEPASGPTGATEIPISATFAPADVNAVVGSNYITIERTGGDDGPEGFAWIQFDYYNLEVDTSGVLCTEPICAFSAASTTINPGASTSLSWVASAAATLAIDDGTGPQDVTGNTTLGQGSIPVSPVNNTTYILSSTGPAGDDTAMLEVVVRNITSFTTDKSQIDSGEFATLSWVVDPAATSVVITADVGDSPGDVTGLSQFDVSPTQLTTYTLTSTRGPDIDTATVVVSGTAFAELWQIGIDNNNNDELEQEMGDMAFYYLEDGDYTGLVPAGELWTNGMEPWQDVPGTLSNGDPGFPRALTTGFSDINIYFQLDETQAAGDAFLNFFTDIQSVRTVGAVQSTHDMDFLFNDVVFHSVAGQTLTPIEAAFSATDVGAQAGPNVLTLRRTGGTTDYPAGSEFPDAAWIVFDYLQLSSLPGSTAPFVITDVSRAADGSSTIFTWNSKIGAFYVLQRSSDLRSWEEITDGYPSQGAQTSYTDTEFTPLNALHYFRVQEE